MMWCASQKGQLNYYFGLDSIRNFKTIKKMISEIKRIRCLQYMYPIKRIFSRHFWEDILFTSIQLESWQRCWQLMMTDMKWCMALQSQLKKLCFKNDFGCSNINANISSLRCDCGGRLDKWNVNKWLLSECVESQKPEGDIWCGGTRAHKNTLEMPLSKTAVILGSFQWRMWRRHAFERMAVNPWLSASYINRCILKKSK